MKIIQISGIFVAMAVFPAVAYAQSDQELAPDFRGHISYAGSYDGKVSIADNSSTNIRTHGLDLRLPGMKTVLGLNTKPISGGFQIELEMNGPDVTIMTRATGGLNAISGKGTRHGTQCVFPEDNGTLTAYCGKDGFRTQFKSASGGRQKFSFSGTADTVKIIDRVQQEALARAEAARKEGEFQSYLGHLPVAMRAKANLFVSTLEADSRGWVMNRLDAYSVRNVRVEHGAAKGASTIYGEYTINGGSPGWMKLSTTGTQVQCVEFFDFPGNCRAVGRSPGQGIAMGMIGAMLDGGASGSGGSGGTGSPVCRTDPGADECTFTHDRQERQEHEEQARDAQAERMSTPNSLGW